MSLPSHYRSVFLTGAGRIELRHISLAGPGPGEVVVRIRAATTCGTDVKVYRRGGHPRMLVPPCPFGHEMTGRIEAVGGAVTDWRVGDEVVVANSASCGECRACRRGRENLCHDLRYLNGAFSELLVVPPRFVTRSLHRRPPELEPSTAALAEPLACVVHALERMRRAGAEPVPGSRALVLGGGPLGLMFVDRLSSDGWEVTLEDRHAARRAMATELGASHTLLPDTGARERAFDTTVDATGSAAGWKRAVDAARPGGVVNLFGGRAPGDRLELDATRLHYEELTVLGTYHHRPVAFRSAIEILSRADCRLDRLITRTAGLEGVGAALDAMIGRRALKVAILPDLTP